MEDSHSPYNDLMFSLINQSKTERSFIRKPLFSAKISISDIKHKYDSVFFIFHSLQKVTRKEKPTKKKRKENDSQSIHWISAVVGNSWFLVWMKEKYILIKKQQQQVWEQLDRNVCL